VSALSRVFQPPDKSSVMGSGRKSVVKQGDDEAQVHERLANCRRTPMHHRERTLSEPGMRIWTPSSDLAQSRRREPLATEVPGCQWDALKPLWCGCQMTIIRPPAMPSLTAPVPRAGPAVVSPEPRRSTSNRGLEVLRRGSGEATVRLRCERQRKSQPPVKAKGRGGMATLAGMISVAGWA